MAMTPFEKALLGELKGIRKAIEKIDRNNEVDIPPHELLAMQMAQMQQSEEKAKVVKKEKPLYDPLGRKGGVI
ncbi:hypothetical protein MUB24_03400 [Lederbergia sp. NSJ-179]|uniref:hypothetical protein n=1 Tax=Lederbergia sp. NSJ-179 TaxID=2931402 RepID=UPI001FD1D78F|nr:hypothetical protein [Lederbergia sp. NSJ-179]MCJ7839973.1 hypothetical protein [Lederbergia sp. NSJ-179]